MELWSSFHIKCSGNYFQNSTEKDVDGLREDSLFLPAVVLAVKKILTKQRIYVLSDQMDLWGKSYEIISKCHRYGQRDFDPEKIKTLIL